VEDYLTTHFTILTLLLLTMFAGTVRPTRQAIQTGDIQNAWLGNLIHRAI